MRDFKKYIRNIPDFPKKGILFRDITTILNRKKLFKEIINNLADRYRGKKIDAVVAVESRGFIFGSALAYKLGAALIPVRKKGKLPHKTLSATYLLEYGEDSLEIHEDAFRPGSRVLLIDDLLATGGTINAVVDLVKKLKAKIVEAAFIIELSELKGRSKLKDAPVYSMVQY